MNQKPCCNRCFDEGVSQLSYGGCSNSKCECHSPKPESGSEGVCCEKGNFGDDHECMKQPPTEPESEWAVDRANLMALALQHPLRIGDCLDSAYLAGLDASKSTTTEPKASNIFEGKNSSLRKTFDEATEPENEWDGFNSLLNKYPQLCVFERILRTHFIHRTTLKEGLEGMQKICKHCKEGGVHYDCYNVHYNEALEDLKKTLLNNN